MIVVVRSANERPSRVRLRSKRRHCFATGMTVLRIVEPIDRPVDSRTRLCSVLISLLLHVGLAVLLWCVVYVTVQFEPISLAASFSAGSQIEVPLEFVDAEVESGNPPPAPQNSSPTQSPTQSPSAD